MEHPPLHLCVVAIEKEAFGSPSTNIANMFFELQLKFLFIMNVIEFSDVKDFHSVVILQGGTIKLSS